MLYTLSKAAEHFSRIGRRSWELWPQFDHTVHTITVHTTTLNTITLHTITVQTITVQTITSGRALLEVARRSLEAWPSLCHTLPKAAEKFRDERSSVMGRNYFYLVTTLYTVSKAAEIALLEDRSSLSCGSYDIDHPLTTLLHVI